MFSSQVTDFTFNVLIEWVLVSQTGFVPATEALMPLRRSVIASNRIVTITSQLFQLVERMHLNRVYALTFPLRNVRE